MASRNQPWRHVLRQIDSLDDALYDAICETESPLLDWSMPRITNAADHSGLWFTIAAALGVSPSRRARRAAIRGVMSIAVTSLVANQIAKRIHNRRRPDWHQVPPARRSVRHATSSSFPSGHSASAAAFASSVAMEVPSLRIPLESLAALVGLSRVATGAHYPSDVAAGFLLGSTIAAAGRRLIPPLGPPNPVPQRAPEQVQPRPDGDGVILAVNPASHSGEGTRVLKQVKRALPNIEVVTLEGEEFLDTLQQAARDCEVLAVAGGDGTVAAAAAAAMAEGKPLAVFPAGTFNHFAKDSGAFPLPETINAIKAGSVTKVDVAYLNDKVFLNTASVGDYIDFVRIRERYEKRIGKPLAALYAGIRTLRKERAVRLRINGQDEVVNFVFLGNGQYQPKGFAPSLRERMDDGLIDLRTLRLKGLASKVRMLIFFLSGEFARSRDYTELAAPELDIELLDGPAQVARDGELGEVTDHLRVRVEWRALTMYRPLRVPKVR